MGASWFERRYGQAPKSVSSPGGDQQKKAILRACDAMGIHWERQFASGSETVEAIEQSVFDAALEATIGIVEPAHVGVHPSRLRAAAEAITKGEFYLSELYNGKPSFELYPVYTKIWTRDSKHHGVYSDVINRYTDCMSIALLADVDLDVASVLSDREQLKCKPQTIAFLGSRVLAHELSQPS